MDLYWFQGNISKIKFAFRNADDLWVLCSLSFEGWVTWKSKIRLMKEIMRGNHFFLSSDIMYFVAPTPRPNPKAKTAEKAIKLTGRNFFAYSCHFKLILFAYSCHFWLISFSYLCHFWLISSLRTLWKLRSFCRSFILFYQFWLISSLRTFWKFRSFFRSFIFLYQFWSSFYWISCTFFYHFWSFSSWTSFIFLYHFWSIPYWIALMTSGSISLFSIL